MKPVALDLCCGLGGWTAGLLSEGWDVIGFDIESHEYGDKRYPADLILKSILEINGYDLRAVNPALVVASPPCQEFSYMAMPWKRGKQIAAALPTGGTFKHPFPEGYTGSRTVADLTALYRACFRIAREIGCPIVLENVKGAQAWVGRANAHYGSYYLWGDVGNVGGRVVRADRTPRFGEYVRPNLRSVKNSETQGGTWFNIAHGERVPGNQAGAPQRGDGMKDAAQKREGRNFHAFENGLGSSPSFNGAEHETRGLKTEGRVNKRDGFDHTRHLTNQRESSAVKNGGDWFASGADCSLQRRASSKSDSRKAASAMIAEIPFPLAQHIARVFKPR